MIRKTVLDGVPVLLAPVAGPMQAGLTFRVGRVDETLPRAGLTHLVEHLALYHLNVTDHHFNGATGTTTTTFITQGEPPAVAGFLTGVCAALTNLPVERLATEKEILRTEEATRSGSPGEAMALWRYGAQGTGLISYPEWGLHTITADDVRAWAATYFTRENAVLWIAGDDVPDGLRLDLPAGVRRPLPPEPSVLTATPAYFGGGPVLVLDSPVPRSAASMVYARVLERTLFRDLRQEAGVSYTTATEYCYYGGPDAVVAAMVDALPEKRSDAVERFVAVLDRLAGNPARDEDLAAVVAHMEERYRHPEAAARRLPRAALDALLGQPVKSTEELMAGLTAVTADDVREVAAHVRGNALMMVPQGIDLHWAGFEHAPDFSRYALAGKAYRSRADHEASLILSDAGVSWVRPDGPATVTFDRCAAVLRHPDGGRLFIGEDGISVQVEPALHRIPAKALSRLDSLTPAHLVVHGPERSRSEIPHAPVIAAWRRSLRRARVRLMVSGITLWRSRWWMTLILVAATLACFIAGGMRVDARGEDDALGLALWMCFFVLGSTIVYRRRQYGRW